LGGETWGICANEKIGILKIFNIMAKKKNTKENPDPEKTLDGLIRTLRQTLMKQGLYTPEMARQVELTASTLLLFRKVRDVAMSEAESVTIKETSREEHSRIKNNPIFFMYKEYADLLQRNLRALNMNKELTKGKDDKQSESDVDPLALLMRDQVDK
jgi:hypothetical protein